VEGATLGAINEVLAGACGRIRYYFCRRTGRLKREPAMLLRLLCLFVLAAAPVVLVASPTRAAPEKVQYDGDAKPGTIVIQTGDRSLYLITGKDQALKYSVGVGRSGQQWFGTTRIASKHIKPAWKPPASLRGKRSPDARRKIRWGPRRWCWSTTNSPSTAPTILARSTAWCPRAASACTTGTSRTCTAASVSVRGWCL
jgi:hypothetical protein